jgi:transcription termination factor Rho
MFEISKLKDKTLVELQEIAKTIGAKKYSQLNKLDLVYLILDIQASVPTNVNKKEPAAIDGKKRG